MTQGQVLPVRLSTLMIEPELPLTYENVTTFEETIVVVGNDNYDYSGVCTFQISSAEELDNVQHWYLRDDQCDVGTIRSIFGKHANV
jgi:hypothetical protein